MSAETHDKGLTLEQLFLKALNNHPDRLVIEEVSTHDVEDMETFFRDWVRDPGNEGD